MHMDTAFPSKFLRASDLQGKSAKVVIARYGFEEVGDEKKLILYFEGKQKGLVTNKTNATTIAHAYGMEMDDWIGAEIELFMALVDFQGRQTEAIRLRIPPRRPQAAAAMAPNARERAAVSAGAMRADDDPLDDSIPF